MAETRQLELPLPVRQASPTTPSDPLTPEKLRYLYEDIRRVYLADSRPWVIGYSGGKDSTTALQMIWIALSQLPRQELTKPIYVISSDTLVESPVVAAYLTSVHAKISEAAGRLGMPVITQIVYPAVHESFWVNMIGKGYPAPYKRFRWCTDRLKIQPANRFIMDQVARYGEVVLVLGVRRAESATRAQVMALHKRVEDRLSRHSTLTNAWVYTPIEDFSTDDVWNYLLSVPSPWGGSNHDLLAMYRSASAGECPLVVDTTTPSCGNSRFGCWTCTVVDRDKSMEAMIQGGEEWMEPLLEMRDWLAETQDPETKQQYRSVRRRDGKVHYWGENNDKLIWGPYKLEVRQEILRRLLNAQTAVRATGPDPEIQLIRPEELLEIRREWLFKEGDWQDSLPIIYREATGQELTFPQDDLVQPGAMELELLAQIAAEEGVPSRLLIELLDLERQYLGLSRRGGIFQKLEALLNKDWRADSDILDALPAKEMSQGQPC